MKTKPDFIIIGAGKSGTTSLHYYLGQHPKIFMTEDKEPNYYALIGTSLDEKEIKHRWPGAVTNPVEYEKLFHAAESDQLAGEASPLYLYTPGTAENIYAQNSRAKLIAIFRQPTMRLWSRYLHLARENKIPAPFEDTLDRSSIWWQRNDLISEGFYGRHLEAYLRIFKRNQILFLKYEDFNKNPNQTLEQVFEFLGVENISLDTETQWNKSGFIKNPILNKFVGGDNIIKKSINVISPTLWDSISKSEGLKKFVQKIRNKNLVRPELDPYIKSELDKIYMQDMQKTAELTGLDLSNWWK